MRNKSFLIILVVLSLLIFVSCQGSDPNEYVDEPVDEEESTEEMNEEESSEEIDEEESTQEMNEEETETEAMEEESTEEMFELTLEELSEYDGKDGSRAYVAVEGVIYDVTALGAWQNGTHNGVTAGKDLTDEIMNQSPHGTSTLSKAEKVGKLVEEEITEEIDENETNEGMLELTLDELSEFDGKDGNRAYVAVEGVIYDVTALGAWQNGTHNGVTAGKDLTDEIMNQSPHGTSTLSKAEKVGRLIE